MTLIKEFLNHLAHELNYSELTVSAYGADLEQWAGFATSGRPDELRPMDVTQSDMRQWISHLARNGCSARTLKRKSSSLRAFFRFLMRVHGLAVNPMTGISLPKPRKNLPVYIRPEETSSVLSSLPADDFTTLRDKLMLDLLYSTGMRCSELTGLLDRNVDTSKGELKVMGKRNKERVIPFGPQLAEAIDSYRTVRDSSPSTAISPADPSAPLMVRENGEPLYRSLVYRVVHRILSEGGAHAERLSPHVMRHSMATDMLNSGAPIAGVQQLLGHASLTSTQVYTHVAYRDLKNNYQLAHPRAQTNKGGHYGH
ncbi:MAG: tyrosine-type recombinase/integrase [Duncaniella sp.]|nr:tyrosine-type recombinase/integrase [Duncaniella sp.]MDE5751622.1 tyrosine-type recombinase/integrase [Duncaniella sp.]MDE5918906.1 tyrosine-type recombinase/integrase [Duncaniella sp.]MDE6465257.1 tyrosine-type recombinase/integrase [Duncaniella sp.]